MTSWKLIKRSVKKKCDCFGDNWLVFELLAERTIGCLTSIRLTRGRGKVKISRRDETAFHLGVPRPRFTLAVIGVRPNPLVVTRPERVPIW